MSQSNQNLLIIITCALTGFLAFTQPVFTAEQYTKNTPQVPSLVVNINKATAEEIADILIGIGISKAKTIVKYREEIGSFKSLDELLEVKGIGPATLEKNRHKMQL